MFAAAVVVVFVLVEVVVVAVVVVVAEWQAAELVVPQTATGEPPTIEHVSL